MLRLAHIRIFPIKSFDSLAVESACVLPSGALEHDRRYALIDADGRPLNAKRTAQMQLLRSNFDLTAGKVTIAGYGDPRTFYLATDRGALAAWLSNFFGLPLRLEENAERGFPDDTAAPGPTVISTTTLETVAGWFPGLTLDDVRRRFRANLEIEGVEPFWEDHLYGEEGQPVPFQVGEVRLVGTNPCQRCIVPTRSPDTSERYEHFAQTFEQHRQATLPTWATRSRFNHYYRLAVNTRGVGTGEVRVGDLVLMDEG